MRVLVTGGAGFIGAALVRRLRAERGHEVAVLDDLSTGDPAALSGTGARLTVGDVRDAGVVHAAVAGADAVVHLAAVASVPSSVDDPLRTHAVNATGTLHVLEAARATGGPPVVVASSSAVYGPAAALPTRETAAAAPASPYAASKLAAEAYALSAQAVHGLPTLALRFFNVYGPGQRADHVYAAAVPAFVSAALAGRAATVHGDGGQTRDLVHVDTVTGVLADAVDRRLAAREPVNLATGRRTSLLELLDVLGDVLGHRVDRVHVPERVGDVRHSAADTGRLRALLGGVEGVDLHEGLVSTVAWARAATATRRSAPADGRLEPSAPAAYALRHTREEVVRVEL